MSFEGDPLAFYGKCIANDYHASLMAKLPQLSGRDRDDTNFFDISDESLRFFPSMKVGILGAGVGGLYTALILDCLGIDFEILEASDRVGGRLATYRFPQGQKYDYYDAGAMRYPLPEKDEQGQYKNGIMKRLADLIGYLDLEDKLIPYYYEARKEVGDRSGFYYFNGIRRRISETPVPPDFRETGVGPRYIRAGTDAITGDVVKPFARMLLEDIKHNTREGWEVMMANDSYSVRAYMSFKYIPSVHLNLPPEHLPTKVVNWCEHMENSTKAYERALTEEVFESLAFGRVVDHDFGGVDWKCFDGGSEVLTQRMAEVINNNERGRIHFGRRVTAIRRSDLTIDIPVDSPSHKLPSGAIELETPSDSGGLIADRSEIIDDPRRQKRIIIPGAGVEVSLHNNSSRIYSHVISTLPLPVLRTIDTKDAGMTLPQKNALRQLQYGPSVKIAIRFKEPWWTTRLHIVGGQSFTDLPIRTIVYPSYGVNSDTPSTVLIASYCWTTDAERLGSLAVPGQNAVLKELVLRNLAEAHGNGITYEFLKDQFLDMHVKDWSHDALTMGAFAQFGPGDFQDLFNSLGYPAANKRLHFAGEAISTRHAWVVGALDSAWRAVEEYLCVTRQTDKLRAFENLKMCRNNMEWASPPGQFEDPQANLLNEHLGLINQAILGGKIEYADY
ncbi:hypothetical protein EDD17DRAFT_1822711 [Pisolithus thermaeus]|nr:hypothetical protein EDD17DRAFT_1822711 [Pisolithus thermaeus]